MAALTWEELELPVLRYVREHVGEDTGELPYKSEDRFLGIPNLTLSQVGEAIERLEEHGLVAASAHSATFGYQRWYRLRPTADGLRVLGEWPPAESASVNAALVHILRALAGNDDFQDEDRSAARRAAGTVANLSGDVVLDVLKNEVSRLAGGGGT